MKGGDEFMKRFNSEQKKKLKSFVHTLGKCTLFILTLIEKIINIFGF